MRKNKIKVSFGEHALDAFVVVFMLAMMAVMIYPLWHVVCASFSNPRAFASHTGLLLWPDGYSVDAYRLMAKNPMIFRGYVNSIYILVMSVAVNMVMTAIGAYVLSRRGLMLNKIFMVMIIVTMYFSGGMIPTYMNIMQLHMENTYWSLIIPGAISTYNLIVMRTGFAAVPVSLEEAARIDGASDFRILWKIIIPLSKATFSVIFLYYAVANWNSWFNAMLYLTDRSKFPLQLVLREILLQNDTTSMMSGSSAAGGADASFVSEIVKYAVIVVSVAPMLCIYPFIQKYFAKGMMMGAVKE